MVKPVPMLPRSLAAACIAVSLAALAGCSAAPTYNWKAESAIGYKVGPGDKIRVIFPNHHDFEGEFFVRPDGAITLGPFNAIQVAGRSVDEVAQDLKRLLLETHQLPGPTPDPLTVQILEVKSYRIYVVGEVNKPADMQPTQPVSVLMGLAMAGGFTRFANPDRIVIVRRDARGERRIPFDYSAVVERGELQQNLMLQSGDTVIVP